MDSSDNSANETYDVFDSRGRRRVVDGKEFPISEEEYRKENPEHKDRGCMDCSFVQDKETLFTYLISRELKNKATRKPLFVGKFTMPGWTGHSGFYLFRCKPCSQVSVDYPHGYTNFGLMYLRCDHCRETISLEVIEERALYEREGVVVPKPTREERIKNLEDVIASIENKSVRVVVPGLNQEDLIQRGSRSNFWNVGLVLLALYALGVFAINYLGILN